MNCKPESDAKALKRAYDHERYLRKKAAYEAVHGPKSGANQWTVLHRMTGTPEYKTWVGMKQRCENPQCKDFKNYGGRGILLCDEWSKSFEQFYADMGPRPAGKTIERRRNDLGYSSANCYWATPTEQTRNRRNAINVTLSGETKPLAVWCKERGINYYTAHRKLRREGKSPSEVFA